MMKHFCKTIAFFLICVNSFNPIFGRAVLRTINTPNTITKEFITLLQEIPLAKAARQKKRAFAKISKQYLACATKVQLLQEKYEKQNFSSIPWDKIRCECYRIEVLQQEAEKFLSTYYYLNLKLLQQFERRIAKLALLTSATYHTSATEKKDLLVYHEHCCLLQKIFAFIKQHNYFAQTIKKVQVACIPQKSADCGFHALYNALCFKQGCKNMLNQTQFFPELQKWKAYTQQQNGRGTWIGSYDIEQLVGYFPILKPLHYQKDDLKEDEPGGNVLQDNVSLIDNINEFESMLPYICQSENGDNLA